MAQQPTLGERPQASRAAPRVPKPVVRGALRAPAAPPAPTEEKRPPPAAAAHASRRDCVRASAAAAAAAPSATRSPSPGASGLSA